ncbi:hypothetical protein EVAR_59659_1 [Eumeta japonica]|uniref:Uncharacterized protein n=1 Tax=Eumeta variegata TaxID=151549 RepID=A0A4C1Z2G9_EUMVA|nr:hypothetical protein EVAR_59659_1 [Eumeta japonica]
MQPATRYTARDCTRAKGADEFSESNAIKDVGHKSPSYIFTVYDPELYITDVGPRSCSRLSARPSRRLPHAANPVRGRH